ncbi:MAG TPA: hypothetical protein VGB04_02420 [Allosphingosinicella sp.]|jgi:hypothetical protein
MGAFRKWGRTAATDLRIWRFKLVRFQRSISPMWVMGGVALAGMLVLIALMPLAFEPGPGPIANSQEADKPGYESNTAAAVVTPVAVGEGIEPPEEEKEGGSPAEKGGEGTLNGEWNPPPAIALWVLIGTFVLLCLGTGVSAVGGYVSRQSGRARVLLGFEVLEDGEARGIRARNVGTTVAQLQRYVCKPDPTALDLEQIIRADDKLERFLRYVAPGASVRLPVDSEAQRLLVVVEFEDIFRVVRQSWRIFDRDQDGHYQGGEEGELPGPRWPY